jgi:Domain of unknown function (DUF6457)
MTADEWIEGFTRELETERPSEEQVKEILKLAATAAHASERIAAPVACFIAGRTGRPLADLRAAAERVGGE